MAGKRVVKKKSASAPPKKPKEIEISEARGHQAKAAGDGSAVVKKPKIHSKVVTLHVSIGGSDRKRSYEDFVADIKKRLGTVPYGQDGVHASVTGGYYILDGAVCLPDDYDPKTGTFKKGAVPPQWAGGPKPMSNQQSASQEQMSRDAKELSSDEYDKKYKIGKYRQLGTPGARLITTDEQKKRMEELRQERIKREAASKKGKSKADDVEEDFDWDADEVTDSRKMEKLADESASAAIKKLKGSKKRVVKKPAPKKKTVRRVKK